MAVWTKAETPLTRSSSSSACSPQNVGQEQLHGCDHLGKLEQELHQPVLAGSCTPLTQLSGRSAWEQQQQQGLEGTSLCSWDLWESFGNWCTRGEVPGEQHPTSRGSVTRKQTQIFSPCPPEGVSPRLQIPSRSCAMHCAVLRGGRNGILISLPLIWFCWSRSK